MNSRFRLAIFEIVCLFAMKAAAVDVPANLPVTDWPQWRGPTRDGVWKETGVVEKFSASRLPLRSAAAHASGCTIPPGKAGRTGSAGRTCRARKTGCARSPSARCPSSSHPAGRRRARSPEADCPEERDHAHCASAQSEADAEGNRQT